MSDHMRHLMLETQEYALQVHIDEETEVVLVQVLHRRGLAGHASVVEGDVDPAEPVEGPFVEIGHRAGVAHVDLRELNFALLYRFDFILEARALSGAEASHEQGGAGLGESFCRGAPYPGCSPNEKDAFAGKVVGHLHRGFLLKRAVCVNSTHAD